MSLAYNPSERNIFGPYYNGAEVIHGDPVRIHRKLEEYLDGQANDWIAQARSKNEVEAGPAKDRVVAATRIAFDMVKWNPRDLPEKCGATEQDCWNAINMFLIWIESKKASTATLPT